MNLAGLATSLRQFAAGDLSLEALRASFIPSLEADPLDLAESDDSPWDRSPEDERLYWRLLHLFDTAPESDEPSLRRVATRLVRAVEDAGSATTLELLALVLDQDRFCAIVHKHGAGIISRTSFLSVIAESGYPPHVKLWLQHAGPGPLHTLCERLESGDYTGTAFMLERRP
jgi:hypothetical protein